MKTLGEKRMNIVFKEGNNDMAQNVLERAAREIDKLENIREDHPVSDDCKQEFDRAISIAQTHAEQCALNTVKALSYTRESL